VVAKIILKTNCIFVHVGVNRMKQAMSLYVLIQSSQNMLVRFIIHRVASTQLGSNNKICALVLILAIRRHLKIKHLLHQVGLLHRPLLLLLLQRRRRRQRRRQRQRRCRCLPQPPLLNLRLHLRLFLPLRLAPHLLLLLHQYLLQVVLQHQHLLQYLQVHLQLLVQVMQLGVP